MIKLSINGEMKTFPNPITLSEWVATLTLSDRQHFAIERNGKIVPRSQYVTTFLADGDCLEVVVAVGGG